MRSGLLIRWLTPAAVLVQVASASLQVLVGGTWTADGTDHHVQAHGGQVIQSGGSFYMIGEDKTDGSSFQNINCYRSSNLVEWEYVGALLTRQSSGDLGPNRVVERPKVIYNDSSKQWVLWMHIDSSSYGEAKTGVATGSSVCGQYTYRGSFQPLGLQSRDMGLFKDDDGSGYLLTEDRQNGLRIERLSSDYLSVQSNVHLFAEDYEAPALIKRGGTYYMFASRLTGWDPNDNMYTTATSLSGPWSSWKTFAQAGSNTYASQTTYIAPLGSGTNAGLMYMGDRWVSDDLASSTYIWLPLTISGTTVSMAEYIGWVPNTSSGTWSQRPSETTYQGESGTAANSAKTVSCSACSGGSAIGYIGGDSNGKATFSNVQSSATTETTIRIMYRNGDSTQRQSKVTVNGVSQVIAFLPTGSDVGISTLNANLNSGSSNTIVFEGVGGGAWGADVDALVVPSS